MSEMEGFKINVENIVSNAMNTVNSSMSKNKKQGFGIKGFENSGSTGAIQNPVSGIAGSLSGSASNAESALAKAALGETAGEKLSNFANEISENLSGNLDTFQSTLDSINNSVSNCSNIGTQGNNILAKSFETVNGNSNLVGLSINVFQGQGNTSAANTNAYHGMTAKNNAHAQTGRNTLANEVQAIGINIVNNKVADDNKISADNSGEEKQVFSCDWGNGAKTADEIETQNNQIKTFGKDNGILAFAGKILNKKSPVNNADNSNSEIQKELDSVIKQENEEVKNISNNENNNKDIKELQQRVEGDFQGVQSTDSINTAGISREQGYKTKIASNNAAGSGCFGEAKELTAQARELAESGRVNFLDAAQKNREAAELFKSNSKEEAKELANEAMQINAEAQSNSEQSASEENKSRQKQSTAFNLANESMSSVIPQFKSSTQQRVSDNQQSLDTQKATKDIIEAGQNISDSNISLAKLESLKSKEDDLLSKYDNQKDLFSGIFDFGTENEVATDKKLANLIA